MFDTKCLDLAKDFFEDHVDDFPKNQHTALIDALAQDIQDAIEGFFEFPDLTMQHLARAKARKEEGR